MTEKTETDLKTLFPGRDVVCKGETIRVVPLYFGQFPTAGKLAKPIVLALTSTGMFQYNADSKTAGLAEGWLAALPDLLGDGGEALMAFFAFCVAKPRSWFDTLPADEGLKLAEAIFEENRSFFSEKVLPVLRAVGLVKATEAPPAGDRSQPASAP